MKDVKKRGQSREQQRNAAKAMNAKKHRRRRKGSYILYYMLLLIFVCATGIALSLTVFFNIKTIEVVGSEKYTADDIRAVCGIKEGDNLFRTNFTKKAAAIKNALTYVDQVEIERALPDKIIIKVTDGKASGAIPLTGGGYALVSGNGKILETGASNFSADVPLIKGVSADGKEACQYLDGESKEYKLLQQVWELLTQNGLTDIQLIDLSSSYDIKVLYQNRLYIQLGSESQLSYKVSLTKKIIDEKVGPEETCTLDAKEAGKVRVRTTTINVEELLGTTPIPVEPPAGEGDATDGATEPTDPAGDASGTPENGDVSEPEGDISTAA